MRQFLQAISLFVPVFNAAFVAPAPVVPSLRRRDIQYGPVVSINSPSHAGLKVPFPRCSGAGDTGHEDLLFDIEVFPSIEVCGFGNASVNGQLLSTEDSSPVSGQDTFLVKRIGDGSEHSLTASWSFDCLYDIYNYSRRIGNEDRPIAQALLFQFLTLDETCNIDGSNGFTFSFTQSPDAELIRFDTRLWPSGPFMANEWSDLDHLRLSRMPPNRPSHSPHDIALVSPPALPLCPEEQGVRLHKELEQCQTLKCALKAILRKARSTAKTICLKIRPPPPCGKEIEESKGTHRPWRAGAHQSFQGWRNGGPGHGDNQGPPSPHDPLPHHRFRFFHFTIILISILLFAFLIFAFRTIARKCHSGRSQRRAQRRAQRQSRCEARAARRVARRKAWRSWWRRHFHRGCDTDNSEEKRALVAPQEAILETAMQSEIRSLREAADMVSNLVAAEEGRGRLNRLQRTTSFGSETSLPSYRSQASEAGDPPPGYDENGADDVVVDGFQYTPSATNTWTPDSSVVGSPKMGPDDSDDHDDDV